MSELFVWSHGSFLKQQKLKLKALIQNIKTRVWNPSHSGWCWWSAFVSRLIRFILLQNYNKVNPTDRQIIDTEKKTIIIIKKIWSYLSIFFSLVCQNVAFFSFKHWLQFLWFFPKYSFHNHLKAAIIPVSGSSSIIYSVTFSVTILRYSTLWKTWCISY